MSGYRAFGDTARKQALIADVRAKGQIHAGWLTSVAIEGDLAPISDAYGLHPALVRLLPPLGNYAETDAALPFYAALLDAIPVGAETGGLARETLLLAWTDPASGRAKAVGPGPVFDACDAVADLVRTAIDQPVDKKAWRAARTRLMHAQAEQPGHDAVVDLALSLAWDLDQSPGAAQDVLRAWAAAVTAEADASDEDAFTADETATFQATMNRINQEVIDSEIDIESVEAFLAEADRRWAADPVALALKTRSVARRARSTAKVAAWRAAIQGEMLALAARAFASPSRIAG